MAEHGSRFGPEDLARDLAGTHTEEEVRALSLYWECRSQTKVADAMGLRHQMDARRILLLAVERLPPRYRSGFRSLFGRRRRETARP
jgi:hypothetical protein